jgi:hypothetical protein
MLEKPEDVPSVEPARLSTKPIETRQERDEQLRAHCLQLYQKMFGTSWRTGQGIGKMGLGEMVWLQRFADERDWEQRFHDARNALQASLDALDGVAREVEPRVVDRWIKKEALKRQPAEDGASRLVELANHPALAELKEYLRDTPWPKPPPRSTGAFRATLVQAALRHGLGPKDEERIAVISILLGNLPSWHNEPDVDYHLRLESEAIRVALHRATKKPQATNKLQRGRATSKSSTKVKPPAK